MGDEEKINDSPANEMAPPQKPQVAPPERDAEERTQLVKNADPEVQR